MKGNMNQFIIGDVEPQTRLQKCMSNICNLVIENLDTSLNNGDIPYQDLSPKDLIVLTVSNILINLLYLSTTKAPSIEGRLKNISSCLKEINSMTLSICKAIEIEMGNTKISH